MASRYQLQDLLNLMARLRDAQTGCSWAREQTFATIAPYTLEEAYEVVEAIEADDLASLPLELGDLLYQVVYHARMAEEQQAFAFDDVVHGLVQKLIRRHPHIFPEGDLYAEAKPTEHSRQASEQIWQALKKQECQHQENKQLSLLDAVSDRQPALVTAQKLQHQAAQVNFDWPDVKPVLAKLREELDEIEQAMAEGDQRQVAAEVGDYLFAAVNLARHLGVNAEQAVRGCNRKFRRRFAFIEEEVRRQGKDIHNCALEELDQFWNLAKRHERSSRE